VIDAFVATFDPTRFNFIIVSNDVSGSPGLPPVDLYSATGEMDTPDDVLGSFASASLQLSELGSGAIADDGLGQDLGRFDTGGIALAGPAGAISVIFGSLGPGPGPGGPSRSPCVRKQIGAGGALGRAVLGCWAKFAKNSAFDLLGCIAGADQKFVQKFDAARTRRGSACESVLDGLGAVAALDADMAPFEALVTASADPSSKDDRKYRAALFKAASTAVLKALRAHAKDAKKPNPTRLAKQLAKNDAKLLQQVTKAGAKAQKKGITPDVAAAAVVDAGNEFVGAVLAVVGGAG
jgi:hypothetical protein